jgi:capsular polysaccharide biosynthesis protein
MPQPNEGLTAENIVNRTLTVPKLAAVARRALRKAVQSLGACPSSPLCESILLSAQDRGWPVARIHDPFVLVQPVPDELRDHPRLAAQFENNSRLGFPAQHLVAIPNARVKGPGFAVLDDGAYVTEGHWRVSNVINHPLYRKEWPIRRRRRLTGDWYCAMGHWGANYNHWLWDEMPRLLSALPHLPAETRFLVPEPLAAIQRDSLLALGIDKGQLMSQAYDCESTVERLWFATPLGHSEWAATAPDVAIRLRSTLLRGLGVAQPERCRRVYISRSKARYRRLVNESELLPEIRRAGFDVVFPEELTLAEQARTFAGAHVVMSVHGAGLTNTLFCPPNALVLEVHGPRVTRAHYWMMAHTLGHEYRCLVGEPLAQDQNPGPEPDFRVDARGFVRVLEQALQPAT